MSRTELGDRLLVVVDPDTNGGADVAPADVVAVNDDGTINVQARLNTADQPTRLLSGLTVYNSRKELDKALDEHRAMLPGKWRHAPGAEREEWRPTDVYRWVQAAYRPASSSTATPAKTDPETPAKKTAAKTDPDAPAKS